MRHVVLTMALAMGSLAGWATGALAASDPLQGLWEGTWNIPEKMSGTVTLKLIARGGDKYEGLFEVTGPQGSHSFRLPITATTSADATQFAGEADLGGDHGKASWSGTLSSGTLTSKWKDSKHDAAMTLHKAHLTSPTLGMQPPKDAIVLFDGTSTDEWLDKSGQPIKWQLVEDGAMEIAPKSGSIKSKQTFGDHRLHVEFKTPLMADKQGQARGNSGVYVQGRYEVQVLDSFGLPPKDNEAGGIYKASIPRENASLPPGEWQTYDIEFVAPTANDKGELAEAGEITVWHNGRLIHNKVPLKEPTPSGLDSKIAGEQSLMLQDHSNPVQFRNIWAIPRAKKEADAPAADSVK